MRRLQTWICLLLCLVWLVPPGVPQQQAARAATTSNGQFLFTANTELVLVNLVVRDKDGNLVKGLKKSDFTVLEDGKPQQIANVDFEDVDTPTGEVPAAPEPSHGGEVVKGAPPPKPAAPGSPAAPTTPAAAPPKPTAPSAVAVSGANFADEAYRDRRLMVLYFDLTTMQPEDMENVVEQAQKYVKKQMLPADLVGIVTLGNTLQVDQDFTADKDLLLKDLDALNPNAGAGFADGSDGTTDGTADDGNTFAVDDTEFNIANADRSLEAIEALSDMLGTIQQKKSVLFFSSGIQRSGVDNEITLRSAVNAAVKANVVLYSVDARGLQVRVPGGSANTASTRGSSQYNGAGALSALGSNFSQQETVATLANDTGGEAFLDSNDFTPAYTKVQVDTRSYYLISYHSTNTAKDGKYRKLVVRVNGRPDVKVAARPGYYAGKDINHLSASDREGQLIDQLQADVPEQTLPLYANDGYLRVDKGHYFIPVSVAIPGADIPLAGANPKATPSVDIDGMVRDKVLRQIGHIQQSIPLNNRIAGGDVKQVQTKNLQFNTGFSVTPGEYEIRLAARENQMGQMGAFATQVTIPDLDADEVKTPTTLGMSSVLIGNQLTTVRPNPSDPLTASGTALVESVTHVFATNQHLYIYYEIYDPKADTAGNLKVKTNVALYRGRVRAYETPLATITRLTDPQRKAIVVQLDIPLAQAQLKTGYYTCQVNAIDENAGRFGFPRVELLLRAPAAAAASAAGQ